MNAKDLKDWIASLVDDIEFEYKNIHGVISPFTSTNMNLFYDDKNYYYGNVDDLMSAKVIDGHSLNDISEEIVLV